MLIATACQNLTTWQRHQDACNSFFTQTTQKVGLYGTDTKIEDFYTVEAKEVATNSLGTGAVDVAGGLGYGYRTYRNKSLSFKLPTLGIADSISNKITTNSYTLSLKWQFPWLK
jgi:hypothetical protein